MDTHRLICDSGPYQGVPYTRIPSPYLRTIVKRNGANASLCRQELERRGTAHEDLDVSFHSVDRASLDCLDYWRRTRVKGEGIYSWLARMGRTALEEGEQDEHRPERYHYEGMTFAFDKRGEWPILVTVIRNRESG